MNSKWKTKGKDKFLSFHAFLTVQKMNSRTKISLDKELQYMHYGRPNSLSDGFGGFIEQRAEVALLDRNIKVTGTQEPAPFDLEGSNI